MSNLTKDEILEYLKQIKPKFVKSAGIKKIGLFGSYAKGMQEDGSDIDIVILCDKKYLEKLGGLELSIKFSDLKDSVANHFKKDVDLIDVFSEEKLNNHKYFKSAVYV